MTNQTAVVEKMTYVKALEVAVACETLPEDVREKLTALLEQQKKRNSGEKKPTAQQVANQNLQKIVAEVLINANPDMTVTEILEADPRFKEQGVTNQRLTAVITQMVDAGTVARDVRKRKAYFTLVK